MSKTLSAFLDDTHGFANKIIDNLTEQTLQKMEFNVSQIYFDFDKKTVVISYFYIDTTNFPDVILSFDELPLILKRYNTLGSFFNRKHLTPELKEQILNQLMKRQRVKITSNTMQLIFNYQKNQVTISNGVNGKKDNYYNNSPNSYYADVVLSFDELIHKLSEEF